MKAALFSPVALQVCALTGSSTSASCPQQRASLPGASAEALGRDGFRGGDCVCPVPAVSSGGKGTRPLAAAHLPSALGRAL